MEKVLSALEKIMIILKMIPPEYYSGFGIICISIAMFFLAQTDFYSDYCREPNWYKENNEEDTEINLCSDIKLGAGEIIVRPQLEVLYHGEIVCICNIKGLCMPNYDTLSDEYEGQKNKFSIPLAEQNYRKWKIFQRDFEKILSQRSGSEGIWSINLTYIIQLKFQNRNSSELRERIIFLDSCSRRYLSPKEKGYRNSSYWFDLNLYNAEESLYFNDDAKTIIGYCINSV